MTDNEARALNSGDEIFFGGAFYKVQELRQYPHGLMIGILDEYPINNHLDYLNPGSVSVVHPCNACQGGGCVTCNGYGRIVQ